MYCLFDFILFPSEKSIKILQTFPNPNEFMASYFQSGSFGTNYIPLDLRTPIGTANTIFLA